MFANAVALSSITRIAESILLGKVSHKVPLILWKLILESHKFFLYIPTVQAINPIQDGLFWGCSRMGRGQKSPLPKICCTYPTMIKLGTVIPYLKEIQKLYGSSDTPFNFADISIIYRKPANFAISRNTDIDSIQMHNF